MIGAFNTSLLKFNIFSLSRLFWAHTETRIIDELRCNHTTYAQGWGGGQINTILTLHKIWELLPARVLQRQLKMQPHRQRPSWPTRSVPRCQTNPRSSIWCNRCSPARTRCTSKYGLHLDGHHLQRSTRNHRAIEYFINLRQLYPVQSQLCFW